MLLQGVGFNITCRLTSYDYDIQVGHMVYKTYQGGSDSSCHSISEIPSMEGEHAWMIAFAIEPILFRDSENKFDVKITTKFKNDTACRGVAFAQTCELHQGIVEYSVILQNTSISLRYPHWQNDSFLQNLPSALSNTLPSALPIAFQNNVSIDLRTDAETWNKVFMNLYTPVRFNSSRLYCDGEPAESYLYTNCPDGFFDPSSDAMMCPYEIRNFPMTFRDSMSFEIEGVNKTCGKIWRNPMQVI